MTSSFVRDGTNSRRSRSEREVLERWPKNRIIRRRRRSVVCADLYIYGAACGDYEYEAAQCAAWTRSGIILNPNIVLHVRTLLHPMRTARTAHVGKLIAWSMALRWRHQKSGSWNGRVSAARRTSPEWCLRRRYASTIATRCAWTRNYRVTEINVHMSRPHHHKSEIGIIRIQSKTNLGQHSYDLWQVCCSESNDVTKSRCPIVASPLYI